MVTCAMGVILFSDNTDDLGGKIIGATYLIGTFIYAYCVGARIEKWMNK